MMTLSSKFCTIFWRRWLKSWTRRCILSLSFLIVKLTPLFSEHNFTFDIFGVSETKLRCNKVPFNSVVILGFSFEVTAVECSNGGTAIYIKKHLNYKIRKDLETCKWIQLKSTFTEVNLNNEKLVIGCIYRHPSMELSEFNRDYPLKPLESSCFRKQNCSLFTWRF